MNKKYISGIVVIIVILGLVAIFSNQGGPQSQTSTPETNTPAQTPTANTVQPSNIGINATGNIDDVTAAILSDNDSDEPTAAENDPTMLSENDAAISDFGQSTGGGIQ